MKNLSFGLFGAAAVAALAMNAGATTLPFSTGFEAAEGYTNGSQLSSNANWSGDGQDTSGWAISNTAIGGVGAKTGSQYVLVTAPTAGTPTRWQWTVTPVTDFSVNSIIAGSADVKLASPTSGSVNRSTSAGLQMYDAGVNLMAQIDLLCDAQNVYGAGAGQMFVELVFGDGSGFAYNLGVANALNQYVNLGLSVNFQAGTVTGYFNGVALPDVGSNGGASDFHDFDMFCGRTQTTTGGTAARAGFDNYTIAQTPAPGALALLGLGGLVAGRRRR